MTRRKNRLKIPSISHESRHSHISIEMCTLIARDSIHSIHKYLLQSKEQASNPSINIYTSISRASIHYIHKYTLQSQEQASNPSTNMYLLYLPRQKSIISSSSLCSKAITRTKLPDSMT
ncbi:unnamed protein product, partial [Lymnaea stagnalis]